MEQHRKSTVVITGASGSVCKQQSSSQMGQWHVVMACRDLLKAEKAAQAEVPQDS